MLISFRRSSVSRRDWLSLEKKTYIYNQYRTTFHLSFNHMLIIVRTLKAMTRGILFLLQYMYSCWSLILSILLYYVYFARMCMYKCFQYQHKKRLLEVMWSKINKCACVYSISTDWLVIACDMCMEWCFSSLRWRLLSQRKLEKILNLPGLSQ